MTSIIMVISFLLFLIYAFPILYYRGAWRSVPLFNRMAEGEQAPNTRITVIIPARNEEANIRFCLQSLINQSYPRQLFEVIVVDDHSTDSTASIVRSFDNKNVHCIFLKDHVNDPINSYKKKAIEVAIAASTGELVVTTDADCTMGQDWLVNISAFYEKYKPAFIAAPVSINSGNKFIEKFQALDFMTLQGITGAAVHKNLHSMCNGANLAYERKAFEAVGGFKGIDAIASGDDMLLMHKISTQFPGRVMFLKSPEVIVYTQPVDTVHAFINQRIRWASKADKYQDQTILPVLITVYFFNVSMLVLPVIGIFNRSYFAIGDYNFTVMEFWMWLLLFKTAVEIFFLFPVAGFFQKLPLLWWFPFMQPFHIVYTIIAGWLGKFGSYRWKERKVR